MCNLPDVDLENLLFIISIFLYTEYSNGVLKRCLLGLAFLSFGYISTFKRIKQYSKKMMFAHSELFFPSSN
ncbi:hypothetical protein BpHYR1_001114 [Brachionus plicatilis]|uniref:Uncharacterized protein n=1 Tax=Brachionus plicatilis TaxID=10195 RepID=A0A3M7S7F0_BRAPC|nr:hypothetical protein BpHYR1_001114 [Brachionus plicatilis]